MRFCKLHLYQALKANDPIFTFLRFVYAKLFWRLVNFDKTVWQGDSNVISITDAIKQNIEVFYKGNFIYAKDMKQCWLAYRISPWEYCVYDFAHKTTYKERNSFLSMVRRNELLTYNMRNDKEHLNDRSKWITYQLLKPYFKRECFLLTNDTKIEDLIAFIDKHKRVFAKPINACCGEGAQVIDNITGDIGTELLAQSDQWIIEELIEQDERIALLNPSSVNTIRIPSFRTRKGICLLDPSIRMGRYGSCVDNVGAGGIVASIDLKSGKISSAAIDYRMNRYSEHPDSHIKLDGWQVPQWKELMSLVKEVHLALPVVHKYIGFDFALSKRGWVVVEINWGDLADQIIWQKGLKEDFVRLLNS